MNSRMVNGEFHAGRPGTRTAGATAATAQHSKKGAAVNGAHCQHVSSERRQMSVIPFPAPVLRNPLRLLPLFSAALQELKQRVFKPPMGEQPEVCGQIWMEDGGPPFSGRTTATWVGEERLIWLDVANIGTWLGPRAALRVAGELMEAVRLGSLDDQWGQR